MYCHNCGKEIVGAGAFCQSCGARVAPIESQPGIAHSRPTQLFTEQQGVNDGRAISAQEREWALLKNQEEKAKNAPKWILGGIASIAGFFILYALRSAVYSRLNTSTTVYHAIFFLGIGGISLLYGIYLLVKRGEARSKLSNMPDYSNRNGR